MLLTRPATHIIHDLDGVLLDTEPFYTIATEEICSEYGKTFDWSVKANMIGRPSGDSARYLVEALDLPITPEEYLRRRRDRLEELFPTALPKPGAKEFTQAVHALGVAQAVGTSSDRTLLDLKIGNHREWFSIFAACVTGDDPRVKLGKPGPDIFLVAAHELKADPVGCVVFEDSPAGVAAARAAGMQVIALPDPAMDEEEFADADVVAAGYDRLTPADLGL